MNRLRNIIITSRKPTTWLATAVLAIVPTAFAHAGFKHVMGTVARLSGNVLTIKTGKGTVDVKLSERTALTMNERRAQVADLRPGARVVAELPAGSQDNVAQSVKIGALPKPVAVRQRHASHE